MSDLRPLIGITTTYSSGRNGSTLLACPRTYFEAIEIAGGVPVGVPMASESTLESLFDRLDGLLFSGGEDVAPELYGEDSLPGLGRIQPERDRVELTLARWALERDKPVLAICRGIQVLNVAAGGTLFQDLDSQRSSGLDHRESTLRGERGYVAHDLKVLPDTRLARAVGEGPHPANTHHHQAVKQLGDGLTATGYSDDGLVEAVESDSRGWVIGIQCHPEDLWREHEWAHDLFTTFVEEARYHANPPKPRVVGALRDSEPV